MYHTVVMFASYAFVNNFAQGNMVLYTAIVYILVTGITIGISYLSFHFVEKRFLNLKEKFSIVLSGKATESI